MKIDARKILENRLVTSMGLDKYARIMSAVRNVDVSKDEDFQHTFNGFYIVRRNGDWRKIYYNLFEHYKTENSAFGEVLLILFRETGNIEPSFTSKMLATLDPQKPIWDRYIIQNLRLKLSGNTKEEKLHCTIALYAKIEQWYMDYLNTTEARECISVFDNSLPSYSWLSDIKKIDCLLWSIR